MRRRGSAIVIAFFLMAAIGGVAFGIARLFYLDTSASDIYENSTVAYYAAESGIEEGYLRYRFNRQSEVGEIDENGDTLLVNRTNLGSNAQSPVIPPSTSTNVQVFSQLPDVLSTSSLSFYDLRMSYLAKTYGNPSASTTDSDGALTGADVVSANYGSEYFIKRDESVKIDVTESIKNRGDATFFMRIVPDTFATGFDKSKIFVEGRVAGKSGVSEVEHKKIIVTNTYPTPSEETTVPLSPGMADGINYYSRNGIIGNIAGSLSSGGFDTTGSNRVVLYLRPIGCSIVIGIVPTNGRISSPFTTVRSTGYYGGLSRTLEARIDRQSGTVYDLFDFVTYEHQ